MEGDHALQLSTLHHALTGQYANSEDWTWGAEIEGSRSGKDGTIPFGDHSFKRTSGRVQLLGPDSQTDFLQDIKKNFLVYQECIQEILLSTKQKIF